MLGLGTGLDRGRHVVAPFLLDAVPGAEGAWATKKLSSSYSGFCMRVRRSSDDTLLNIGFAGQNFDEAAYTAFVGAGQGFVETLYDQSGNGNDYSQTTDAKQPEVIIDFFGLNPSIRFDGVDDILVRSVSGFLSAATSGTAFVIAGYNAGFNYFFSSSDEATNTRFFILGTFTSGTDRIMINQRNDDTADRLIGDTDLSGEGNVLLTYESAGTASSFNEEVDENVETLTIDSGANTGDWLADTDDRDNIAMGGFKRVAETVFPADIALSIIYPSKKSAADKATAKAILLS